MNKRDLINHIAKRADLTYGQAAAAIEMFATVLKEVVVEDGGRIAIPGLGVFTQKHVASKPFNLGGVKGMTQAHTTLRFKPYADAKV